MSLIWMGIDVSFKYERLPTFCFSYGKIGHDEKHCRVVTKKQSMEKKYGEWLRAGSVSKGSNEGFRESRNGKHNLKISSFRGSGSGGHESKNGDEMGKTVQATVGERIQTRLQKGKGDPRKEVAMRKVRTMLFFAKISLRNRRWLLGSTAESNDYLRVELPGAWEPPDSSCVGQISPTMESQNYFSFGNKN